MDITNDVVLAGTGTGVVFKGAAALPMVTLPVNLSEAAALSELLTRGEVSALDWSRISGRTGGDAAEHVALNHGSLSLTKPNQGVFYGNPVSTIEDAWLIAQQNSLKPVTVGGRDLAPEKRIPCDVM
jgi:hypothetical protein